MKQGTLTSRVVMLVILLAVAVYLGVYAWNSFSDPFSTYLTYAYTVDEGVEATGFLVRQEQVIPGTGNIVDLTRSEGERVARGADVAVVYQSEAAAQRREQIRALEAERTQLQYSLNRSGGVADSAKLSQQVIESIVDLKASVAAGDTTRLEEETLSLKSLVYQRDYTYGDSQPDVAAISQKVQEVNAQIDALNSQSSLDTTSITVSQPGVFSGLADGYEELLTPAMLDTLTPGELDKLSRKRVDPDKQAVGRLITDNTWYFACALSEKEADGLWQGRTVSVRFSRDWSGEVPMTVERVSEPSGGRVAVVLSTDRFLSETTLLRRQTVELVLSTRTGIRVPSQAIRVEQRTVTDEETGEEREVNVTGVYALVGVQSEFKAVTVIQQRDDYCIVTPVPGESEKAARKELRPGDEVIVAAADLFDGKVVR